MIHHPFIGDLSGKTLEELGDTISRLNKQIQWMYKTGRQDMVNQMNMALSSYRDEYLKRQKELWDKKSGQNLANKIDIS